MIVAVIVNYRRPDDTIECLRSLLASDCAALQRIVLIDQMPDASDPDQQALQNVIDAEPRLQRLALETNLGFAGACNAAFDLILAWQDVDAVFLLNNDAIVERECVSRLAAALHPERREEMVAAAMMRYDAPACVDSLGVVFYGCGLAANRTDASQPLTGPCGGAALYGIGLLREVLEVCGEVFDAAFFCYAEDTDLALRARALGYRPVYVQDARVLHKGSLTSGGSGSDLVMYYGLRNSLTTLIKSMPARYFLRYLHYFPLLAISLLLKYARQRRLGLLLRVFIGAAGQAPRAWRARARLARRGLLRWDNVQDGIDSRFYDPEYLRAQLRGLFGNTRGAAR